MTSFASTDTMTKLGNGNAIQKAAKGGLMTVGGLALAGAPRSQRSTNEAFKAARQQQRKAVDDFDNINPALLLDAVYAGLGDKAAKKKIEKEQPDLLRYSNNLAGMAAMVASANKKGQLNDTALRKLHSLAGPTKTKVLMASAGGDNFKERRYLFATEDYNTLMPSVAQLSDHLKNMTVQDLRGVVDQSFYEAAAGKKEVVDLVDATTGASYKRTVFTPDARSANIAAGFATVNPSEIEHLFNPHGRFHGTTQQRTNFIQMLGTNKAVFAATDQGREILRAATNSVGNHENTDLLKSYALNIHGYTPSQLDALDMSKAADRTLLEDLIINDIKAP